jgi:hypothetical protein
VPLGPSPGHKWSEDLVPVNELAERLGSVGPAPALALQAEVSDEDRVTGFWGELEVCRQLAVIEDCGLFRPFPDNETNEILVRRLLTGVTLGIQVKTGQLVEPNSRLTIMVNRSNFVPAPTTFVVVLGWKVPEHVFHEACLVIPSEAISSFATELGDLYEFDFRPAGNDRPNRLDQYRMPLESLAEAFAGQLTSAQTRIT